ncbi:hypothetical protein [Pseudomonas aeruginosa]|nr:hypothetical protein [Pseudomonas aeruginosa]
MFGYSIVLALLLGYHGEVVVEVARLTLKMFVREVLLGFMQYAVAR